MGDESIGAVRASFVADTTNFTASVTSVGRQLTESGNAAEKAAEKISEAGNIIDRTAALQERAAERARRAWQREKLQQDLAADAQKESARAAELAALRQDILARSTENAGNAAGHSVGQYAAASGAVRVLEGGINNNVRAAERFLSTTLGLGPILTAAFPVVGAIAMLGVLKEMVERVEKFGVDAYVLGNELGTGWLDGAVLELEGVGKAAKQADDYIMSLRHDMDSMKERLQQQNIEYIRLTQGPVAADQAQISDLRAKIQAQQSIVAIQSARANEIRADLATPHMITDPKSGVVSEDPRYTAQRAKEQLELNQLDKSLEQSSLQLQEMSGSIRNLQAQILKEQAAKPSGTGEAADQAPSRTWSLWPTGDTKARLSQVFADVSARRQADSADAQAYADQQAAQWYAQQLQASTPFLPVSQPQSVVLARQPSELSRGLEDLKKTVSDTADEFTNLGNILSQTFTQSLDSFNRTVMNVLSTPASQLRGQHPWRNMAAGMAQSLGTDALQYGEGAVMKMLLGRNPMAKLGSKDNPMYVRNADASASSGMGGLLGKLFGSGDSSSPGNSSGSGGGSLVGQIIGGALSGMAGFAGGGEIPSNMPVLVGENGPEILAGAGGRTVIPNDRIGVGGGLTVHNHFAPGTGAADAAIIERHVNRAMAKYIPAAQRMAVAQIRDHNRRVPGSRRI